MDLISIIVPVYNVEKYLRECLDSIVKQTYKNIEVILVDDGSTDGSGDICEEYARFDERIRIIHQENQGVSIARNNGITAANGEYVMFVDSDDWIEPDYCSIPYKHAKEYGADIVIFRHRDVGGENAVNLEKRTPGILSKDQAVWMVYHLCGAIVWDKLYRKELLDGIRFPASRYYEDCIFIPSVLIKAQCICYTDEILYNYRKREGSITTKKTEKYACDFYEMHEAEAVLLENGCYYEEAIFVRNTSFWHYLVAFGKKKPENEDSCIKWVLAHPEIAKDFRWTGKAMYNLLKISPKLFNLMCELFNKRS